ncbi:DUF742 domain-containing protein [Actinacidiphila yanglinensis]|uniref:DUF742 domain-containing protein n=1 Tax=Actinacidiphila yanglinensis TaxID=310779 RepID=UPI0038991143
MSPVDRPPLSPRVRRSAAPPPTGAALPRQRDSDRRTPRVRPYALTGGRTECGHVLLVETFVATIDCPDEQPVLTRGGWAEKVMPELRAIVELCRRLRSVAEISALLRIPLGVVRVLISDLADQGRIRVYGTGYGPGGPDRALLERVLSGLRRL